MIEDSSVMADSCGI